jgi:hypothetical protein
LQRLVDQELTRVLAAEGLPAAGKSGLREAIALLDALATGTRHPVFDLVDGLRSKAFRDKRDKPNAIDKMDIDGILGCVRALIAATKNDTGRRLPEAEAITRVIEACKLEGRFSARQIRDRNRRSKDGKPDLIAVTLLREVKAADCLLGIAAMWASQVFADPPFPEAF